MLLKLPANPEHELFDLIKVLNLPVPFTIAGGAVRQLFEEKPLTTDVDVFFTSAIEHGKARRVMGKYLSVMHIFDTENHDTYSVPLGDKKIPVQLIKYYHPNVNKLLDSFDFTICQFALPSSDLSNIHTLPSAVNDLRMRMLRVYKLEYPFSSLLRLIKYVAQGFTVAPGVVKKIAQEMLENPQEFDY